jgi:hypothetical protein
MDGQSVVDDMRVDHPTAIAKATAIGSAQTAMMRHRISFSFSATPTGSALRRYACAHLLLRPIHTHRQCSDPTKCEGSDGLGLAPRGDEQPWGCRGPPSLARLGSDRHIG